MILALDIGGTKTLAALFDRSPGTAKLHLLHQQRWDSRDFHIDFIQDFLTSTLGSTLGNTLTNTLGNTPGTLTIQAAGFSLAGPIVNDRCHLVNLNRTLDFQTVRQKLFPIGSIAFANDVVATAHGLPVLPSSSFVSLTDIAPEFAPPPYPKAVLSLGTGLGQSLLLSEDSALSSEGSHADFAPRTEQQIRLWRYLRQQFSHVSYERVLSGPGLHNIYSFLTMENPAEGDPGGSIPSPPEITERALSGSCPLSQASLDLFLEILGAQAGNFALQTMSLGGVFLTGGITPRILPALRKEIFLEAFLDKGRFRRLVSQIPIAAVKDDQTALWGAARLALLELQGKASCCP